MSPSSVKPLHEIDWALPCHERLGVVRLEDVVALSPAAQKPWHIRGEDLPTLGPFDQRFTVERFQKAGDGSGCQPCCERDLAHAIRRRDVAEEAYETAGLRTADTSLPSRSGLGVPIGSLVAQEQTRACDLDPRVAGEIDVVDSFCREDLACSGAQPRRNDQCRGGVRIELAVPPSHVGEHLLRILRREVALRLHQETTQPLRSRDIDQAVNLNRAAGRGDGPVSNLDRPRGRQNRPQPVRLRSPGPPTAASWIDFSDKSADRRTEVLKVDAALDVGRRVDALRERLSPTFTQAKSSV